ncbi:hypothetical protein SCLCIDRAFT_1218546 [Scleroderma citrinum Foug A]|uniref:Uncharacterized protein n=1 Tax=Scleroderma citrinum Foug A TaxID=1036808 RepID=A0A0C2Z9M5_9AGAM|nr:hypothetical protein SCLCIDRAFT_1218546 [Scleroderma citrinum Foug A]
MPSHKSRPHQNVNLCKRQLESCRYCAFTGLYVDTTLRRATHNACKECRSDVIEVRERNAVSAMNRDQQILALRKMGSNSRMQTPRKA